MKRLVDNLAWILPALVLVAAVVYSTWWRERPQVEGRITGDFAAATDAARESGSPLLLAVDQSPH